MKIHHGPPNILWVFSDQHRAQAAGYSGDPNACTPNLDAFAERSVNFRKAVSMCPWCSPFRGSLYTGRYASQCVRQTPQLLDPAIPTAAKFFGEAGYTTSFFGKWHLGHNADEAVPMEDGKKLTNRFYVAPERRGGFQKWLGYESSGGRYFDVHIHGHTPDGEVGMYHPEGFETDLTTDLLLEDLKGRAHAGKPFFAVMSVTPPHSPYMAPKDWMDRHDPATIQLRPNVPSIPAIQEKARTDLAGYYAAIENVDHNFGRILETLEQTGMADNTIVFYFADHGDMQHSHGLRDKKSPYEEAIRIPFLVGGAIPGTSRGTATDALMNTVDILPTTLGLCGLDPAALGLPGYDYSPRILDPSSGHFTGGEPDATLIHHLVFKPHAYNLGCTWRGVVTRDGWKYFCTENMHIGMYHLAADPFEEVNLVHRHPFREKRKELLGRLADLLDQAGDTYPLPLPD